VNSRYNNDRDDEREDDREISLGATTILGIFFALVLVCAVCFGFGYSMGRKSTPVIAGANSVTTPDSGSSVVQKSSAGTAEAAPAPASEDQPDAASTAQPDQPTTPPASATPAPAVRTVALVHPLPPTIAKPSAPITPQSIVVQVAAVSHQQDADILLTALKKRGYTGAIRPSPQDKLLHVQLGPFATKKDADVMRQRLISDGYSPIVK